MGVFGEGPCTKWGRSDFEAGTFPGDSAFQGTLGPFRWGRYPAKKPTFPKTHGDLPRFTGSPATPRARERQKRLLAHRMGYSGGRGTNGGSDRRDCRDGVGSDGGLVHPRTRVGGILRHFQTISQLFSRHRRRNIRHAAATVRALRGAPRKGSPRARLLPVVPVYDIYVLEGQFVAQVRFNIQ